MRFKAQTKRVFSSLPPHKQPAATVSAFPRRHAAAMLRLRSSLLAHLLYSPSASPVSPLHRLLSAAAAAHPASPNPSFALDDYLVASCGLARAQAVKASTKLSHLQSPANPDAVLSYLAGLGLSSADVAGLVAKDPNFLCADVDETLSPIVAELTSLGLSGSEIARLVPLTSCYFRRRSIVSRISYYLSLFGSSEMLLRALKTNNTHLLSSSLEKVVKPNVAFLRECGLDACSIAKLSVQVRSLLGTKPECVQAIAARAEAVGVPRGSGMFRQALHAVALLTEEKIALKAGYLKNTFRWSDTEVGIAICKFPLLLKMSKETLKSKSEFLISEVGLEPAYIARRPVMIGYSLEGRLKPRNYVVKFLKANGLLDHDRDYFSTVTYTEKVFVEKIICPHKEAAPHLVEDYAAACKGEVPTRFRFS